MKTSPRTPAACLSSIEPLETRIALSTATFEFTDVDGDKVKIKINNNDGPLLTPQDIQNAATLVAEGAGQQLQKLDLIDSKFIAATVSITSDQVKGAATPGDGRVNVGHIDATGRDLRDVTVDGDLGQIDAGDGDAFRGAIKVLSVKSLGLFGVKTQGPGGSLTSNLQGDVNDLTVKGGVTGATVSIAGSVGNLRVDGSILGGDGTQSGGIFATGDIKNTLIGGDLRGGAGASSGNLVAGGKVEHVTIKGAVVGGSGPISGRVKCDTVDLGISIGGKLIGGTGANSGSLETGGNNAKVKVGGIEVPKGSGAGAGSIASALGLKSLEVAGDVRGGAGDDSGSIALGGFVAMVKIHGSVVGGLGDDSGVLKFGSVRTFLIAGDVRGGSISDADSLSRSGHLFAGRMDKLTIGGSVVAGADESTGDLVHSGSIVSVNGFGALAIGGSLMGNASHRLVVSTAGGQDDVAFGKLSVGGDVLHTDVLAGFTSSGVFQNADVKIGAVTIGRSLIASNLVAGAGPGLDGKFGTPDDTSVGAAINDAAKISSIASLIVKGQAEGDPDPLVPGANFGIVANQLGALSTDGCKTPLRAGAPDVFRLGTSGGAAGDFFAHEVAA